MVHQPQASDDGGGGGSNTKKLKTFKFKGPTTETITLVKKKSDNTFATEEVSVTADVEKSVDENNASLKGIWIYEGSVSVPTNGPPPQGSLTNSAAANWAGSDNNVCTYENGAWSYTQSNA